MKKYIVVNLLIVSCIYISIIIVNYLMDPFNKFNTEYNKQKFSVNTDRRIAKLIDFRKKNSKVIILGGSRSDSLSENFFLKYNIDISNMAYGGGSIYEIIDTFNFFLKNNSLYSTDKVIVGITLDIFNESYLRNEVKKVLPLVESNFRYLTSFYILKKSVKKIFSSDHRTKKSTKKYDVSKTIDYAAKRRYSSYIFPVKELERLNLMSEYCKKNNINLVFFIPPNYIEFDKKIDEYNLRLKYDKMMNELRKLGTIYDFNSNDEIKYNINNYSDGIHFKSNITELIVKDLALETNSSCNIIGK
ncbi:hypothetical protein [Sulfurimonas sp.]|uniref:hypothetical protein n=1 Tax=Sulfurimonas sp. TaxID=2022749 RepID=UPI0035667A6D